MREGRTAADLVQENAVTCFFTAINLGVFVIAWTRGEHLGLSLTSDTLTTYGALRRELVWSGEGWRLATCVFLHLGWIHLLWNTWAMFGWCADIERTVGSGWFAFAYLTTGIGASAISVIGHPAYGAGASGAGFGMIAVILSILYRRSAGWNSFLADAHVRNILANTGIWVLIGFAGLMRMDNYAHIGGFVLGIPCGLLLEARRGRNRGKWLAALGAYILVWTGLVAAACVPGLGFQVRGFEP